MSRFNGSNGHSGDYTDTRAGGLDRLPPQNLEAERGVIGGILLDNDVMHEIAPFLKPDDFYRAAYQTIYRTLLALYNKAHPIDTVILAEELERAGQFEGIGGDATLEEIMEGTPHSANAVYYAGIVQQKSVARQLIEGSAKIIRNGYSNNFTAEDLVGQVQEMAVSIDEQRAGEPSVTLGEIIEKHFAEFGTQVVRAHGIPSGFPDLDHLTDGLVPGRMVVLAARPSMGKTALALAQAEHVAREGRTVLIVSLEMDRMDLTERLIVARSRIDAHKFRGGHGLPQDDLRRLADVYGSLQSLPIHIDDCGTRTCTQIFSEARRLKIRNDLALLVVDYIQLISPSDLGNSSNRQEQVSAISRRLKALAMELKIPVLVLAQLNRQAETREGRRPLMSDLRESGAIEQDADQVLLLYRPEYYDPNDSPGVAEVIVAKNRSGETGIAKLTFLKHLAKFESIGRGDPFPGEPAF